MLSSGETTNLITDDFAQARLILRLDESPIPFLYILPCIGRTQLTEVRRHSFKYLGMVADRFLRRLETPWKASEPRLDVAKRLFADWTKMWSSLGHRLLESWCAKLLKMKDSEIESQIQITPRREIEKLLQKRSVTSTGSGDGMATRSGATRLYFGSSMCKTHGGPQDSYCGNSTLTIVMISSALILASMSNGSGQNAEEESPSSMGRLGAPNTILGEVSARPPLDLTTLSRIE